MLVAHTGGMYDCRARQALCYVQETAAVFLFTALRVLAGRGEYVQPVSETQQVCVSLQYYALQAGVLLLIVVSSSLGIVRM